jgi:hypothetical protein
MSDFHAVLPRSVALVEQLRHARRVSAGISKSRWPPQENALRRPAADRAEARQAAKKTSGPDRRKQAASLRKKLEKLDRRG